MIRSHIISVKSKAVGLALLAWMVASPAFAQTCQPGQLCNPLRFTSIDQFIQGVLQAVVLIGVPVITVFVVYAGFLFVSARGNSETLGRAKKNLGYVVIGAALILGAWVLATLIGGTVTQLLSGGAANQGGFR